LLGGAGAAWLDGGDGDDSLTGGSGAATASYASAAAAVSVDLGIVGAQATGGSGTDLLIGIDNIIGSGRDDRLTGDGGDNWIEGGAGNDLLAGGDGIDTLSYVGADRSVKVSLASAARQNSLGAGYDTVSGFENLTGSAYNDTLTGSTGNNVIEGGGGNDTLAGGAGSDTASYAHAAAAVRVDLRIVTAAQDTGGAGSDKIGGFENLSGSRFDDTLIGSNTANRIDGGDGDDRLQGAKGRDTLSGGAGADVFAYVDKTELPASGGPIEVIEDFRAADGDRIDLAGIDADSRPTAAGDQAFFLGGTVFTRRAGELIQAASSDGITLSGDVNGDGRADFALLLRGLATPLTIAELLL